MKKCCQNVHNTHTHTHIYIYMCVCVCVCVCACVCLCSNAYIFLFIKKVGHKVSVFSVFDLFKSPNEFCMEYILEGPVFTPT